MRTEGLMAAAFLSSLFALGGCASWTNWAGNVTCRPRQILRPQNEAELSAAVRGATRVRMVGAGHSWSALACTDDVMIETRSLHRVLDLDVAASRIKVEAGVRLSEIDEAAAHVGLALATEPTISDVTAAGAISTASHGTGLASGALSEEVVALEIIGADGTKHTIGDAPGDVERLSAARVGLGAVGVIYSVTFRLVPAFNLEIHERVVDEGEALDHTAELLAANEHVDMFWFQSEHKVFLRTYNRTNAPRLVSHPVLDWLEEWIVRTAAAKVGLAIATRVPGVAALLNSKESSVFREQTDVDRSDHIFHRFPGHQKVYSMEYIVPIARTRDALRAISASLAATHFVMNTPTYLRFIGGAGDGALSPMRGRPSCALEVLSYVGFEGWESFFRDLELRLRALGGRPHWGKLFFANPRALYEDATWARVNRVRRSYDPNGKFLNELTRSLFEP